MYLPDFSSAFALSDSETWIDLLTQIQNRFSLSQLWIALSLIATVLLALLNIGSKLSSIFKWLGVESPINPSSQSTENLSQDRRRLLARIHKDIEKRLAMSLHELVKLDISVEEQPHEVGSPKIELVPEDSEGNGISFGTVERSLGQKEKNAKTTSLKNTSEGGRNL